MLAAQSPVHLVMQYLFPNFNACIAAHTMKQPEFDHHSQLFAGHLTPIHLKRSSYTPSPRLWLGNPAMASLQFTTRNLTSTGNRIPETPGSIDRRCGRETARTREGEGEGRGAACPAHLVLKRRSGAEPSTASSTARAAATRIASGAARCAGAASATRAAKRKTTRRSPVSSAAAGDVGAEAVARANPAMGRQAAGLGRPVTPTRASGGWVWSGLLPGAWGLMRCDLALSGRGQSW